MIEWEWMIQYRMLENEIWKIRLLKIVKVKEIQNNLSIWLLCKIFVLEEKSKISLNYTQLVFHN